VDLHPTSNGGEKTLAHIVFNNRVMTLQLSSVCYGNHFHQTEIYFENPDQMIELANALNEVAYAARKEFKENS
jgi:hypothetical protein